MAPTTALASAPGIAPAPAISLWSVPARADQCPRIRAEVTLAVRRDPYACNAADDAALVVTELFTNALKHGAGAATGIDAEIDVCLAVGHTGYLALAISNDVEAFPRTRRSQPGRRDLPESGRGLGIVESLSDACGAEVTADRVTVWALLAPGGVPA